MRGLKDRQTPQTRRMFDSYAFDSEIVKQSPHFVNDREGKVRSCTFNGGGGGIFYRFYSCYRRYRCYRLLQVGKVPLYWCNGLKPTVSYALRFSVNSGALQCAPPGFVLRGGGGGVAKLRKTAQNRKS